MATIAIDARKWNDYGIGTYVRSLVGALLQSETSHDFLLLMPSALIETDEIARLTAHPGLQTIPVEARSYSARELFEVARVLEDRRPDLYHSTHYVLPLRLPVPTIVTVHDLIHLLFPQFLPRGPRGVAARLYARWMLRSTARRAARIITPSEHTAADVEHHLGVARDRLRVVHNGVDANPPPATDEAGDSLRELGVRRPFTFFLGNPKPHKNLAGLFRAHARHLSRSAGSEQNAASTLQLVCAGIPDAALAEVRRELERSGVPERVRLLGFLDQADVAALFAAAESFVYPSLYEGFGLPVLEAMAAGVPVLCSRTSALGEVAGNAALTVDPSDETALAAALTRLHTDSELRQRLRQRGLERAAEFSWSRAANETVAVYDELLSSEAAR